MVVKFDPILGELRESDGGSYSLPTASDSVKGGVKIGSRLTMTGEVLSADVQTAGFQPTSEKAQPNGYASLGSDGKIPSSQLHPIAITSTYVVASQSAQLALTAQEGDIAVRSDLNKSYVHNGGTAGTMADWTELLTPTDTVLSVNSKTGAVTLTTADISDTTDKRYVTEAEKTKLSNLSGTNTGDVTVTDTATVDMTLTGQNVKADVIQSAIDHGSIGGLTDDDHTQYLLATGARTGGSSSGQVFTQPIIITNADYPNSHAQDSDYFNTTVATSNPPTDWTTVDAAAVSNVNVNMKGAWFLNGASSDTSWKYRRRLQAITETSYMGVNFGPIYFRDGGYNVDLKYYFGIYADDGAGNIQEDKYTRMELMWDTALDIWKVRHSTSDGTTTNNGDWFVLGFPIPQGIYLRPMTYTAATTKRGYIATTGNTLAQTMLQQVNRSITFNQPWMQIEMDRTGGGTPEDYLFIGGYNRNNLP